MFFLLPFVFAPTNSTRFKVRTKIFFCTDKVPIADITKRKELANKFVQFFLFLHMRENHVCKRWNFAVPFNDVNLIKVVFIGGLYTGGKVCCHTSFLYTTFSLLKLPATPLLFVPQTVYISTLFLGTNLFLLLCRGTRKKTLNYRCCPLNYVQNIFVSSIKNLAFQLWECMLRSVCA